MPYCPDCRTEYRPGFDTCADCNSPLVDSPPEEQNSLPSSLVDKVLNVVGQLLAVAVSSIFLLLLITSLNAASAGETGSWLIIFTPCVLLFAFGWFLHGWLSPVTVWICWSTIGLVLVITGGLGEYSTAGALALALTAFPAAMALPVICGIYFGKTKKLYLFFIPLLAYAALFWIMRGINTPT